MRAMIQLDSDKARLHSKGDQAARDIVQFVRECLAQQKLSHSSKQFELNIYFIPHNICRSEHVPPLWKSRPRGLPARARSSKSSVESRQGRPSGDSQTGGQLFGAVFFFFIYFYFISAKKLLDPDSADLCLPMFMRLFLAISMCWVSLKPCHWTERNLSDGMSSRQNWVQLSQVVEYMRSAGISPKVPDIPDIPDDTLEEDFDKRFNM